jgi:hypothetical protein
MSSPGDDQSLPNGATGPASSGSTSPASSSTTSTSASSHLPLPPLPLEIFHRVMRFLEPTDIVTFRRVSSLWYTAINSEPRLWREITCSLVDDLTDQLALYSVYARPRATGQSGGITHLTIVLEGVRSANHGHLVDIVPLEPAIQALEQVITSLAEFSVTAIKPNRGPLARQGGVRYQSSLRSLRIRLEPQTQVSAWVLHVLSRYRSHPLFCQLERYELSSSRSYSLEFLARANPFPLVYDARQLGRLRQHPEPPARRTFPQHVPAPLAPCRSRCSLQTNHLWTMDVVARRRRRRPRTAPEPARARPARRPDHG